MAKHRRATPASHKTTKTHNRYLNPSGKEHTMKKQPSKKGPTILGTLGLGAIVATVAAVMHKKRKENAAKK